MRFLPLLIASLVVFSCKMPPVAFHKDRSGNKPFICFKERCRRKLKQQKDREKLAKARIKAKEKAIASGDTTFVLKSGKRTKTYSVKDEVNRDSVDALAAQMEAGEVKKKKIKYLNTVLGAVYFMSDSEELDGEAYWVLDDIAAWIEEHPKTIIEVSGHTDNTGSKSRNQSLSKSRVRIVGKYLIKDKGIDKKRLIPAYYGSGIPIATNDTEDGRAENRRVELKVIGE